MGLLSIAGSALRTAAGVAAVTAAAVTVTVRIVRRLVVNTGKRVTGMSTPTREFNEAIDGLFGLILRIKEARADTGPGGTRITLDELVYTVTDGAVKESIQTLWNMIERVVQGDRVSPLDLIQEVAEAGLDLLGTLRDALADGRVTAQEILAGVTDGPIREELGRAIDGVEKVPAELQDLDMWKMIALVQKIAGYLPRVLAT